MRAQLSSPELALIFYNCLSDLGKNFKPLIEEFALFDNLDEKLLFDKKHKDFYEATAFDSNLARKAHPDL